MNYYTVRACRMPGCSRLAKWRGLCQACYMRARRQGTLEGVALPLGAIKVGRPTGLPKTGGARKKVGR